MIIGDWNNEEFSYVSDRHFEFFWVVSLYVFSCGGEIQRIVKKPINPWQISAEKSVFPEADPFTSFKEKFQELGGCFWNFDVMPQAEEKTWMPMYMLCAVTKSKHSLHEIFRSSFTSTSQFVVNICEPKHCLNFVTGFSCGDFFNMFPVITPVLSVPPQPRVTLSCVSLSSGKATCS